MKNSPQKITVATRVQAAPDLAWKLFTDPAHIIGWNAASPDWHCPEAENDLRPGGRFRFRMEARDGSAGFDMTGENLTVEPGKCLVYRLDDGRLVTATFEPEAEQSRLQLVFEAEEVFPAEQQRQGWQAIADHFARYAAEHHS